MMDQKGFTLLEIIMILVILGVLAAIALPKYYDLQSQAYEKAALGAVAEGRARVNQYAAQYNFSNQSWPTAYGTAQLGSDAGDFYIGYTTNASNITVVVSGAGGLIPATVTTMGTMITPGSTY